jgi:DNA-directed RNA polymerase specialized sigma24 family protein
VNGEEEVFFADIAGVSASIIARKYRAYIARVDLFQEAWVWRLEHPQKLADIRGEGEEEDRVRRLRGALCSHMDRVARRYKALALGYEPEDEFFYSLPALRDRLECAYGTADWLTGRGEEPEVKPTTDPAEGGNRVAEMADVTSALSRLSKVDQRLLYLRFGVGDAFETIAANLAVEPEAAKKRVNRALSRLQQELGGPPPRGDRPETIGSRRVVSNAHAQAITGDN